MGERGIFPHLLIGFGKSLSALRVSSLNLQYLHGQIFMQINTGKVAHLYAKVLNETVCQIPVIGEKVGVAVWLPPNCCVDAVSRNSLTIFPNGLRVSWQYIRFPEHPVLIICRGEGGKIHHIKFKKRGRSRAVTWCFFL